MLRISRQTTLALLEQLTPSLVTRARRLSQVADKSPAPQHGAHDGPLIDSKIRERIMAHTQSRRTLPDSTKSKYNTTLAGIAMAIKRRDLASALQLWKGLEDHRKTLQDGDACRLPDTTIKDLHNLFVSSALSVSTGQNVVVKTDTAKDFAFYAALNYSEEALASLMVHYIKLGDSQTVLHLYDEYCQTLGTDNLVSGNVQPEEDISLALFDEEEHESERFDQGRAVVLIAAITAHAMNDSFKAAFETHQESGVHIRWHHKKKFLRHFGENRPLTKKLTVYLDRLMVAFVVARPPSLSRHIMNMGSPHTANTLKTYYNKILNGIFGKQPYLAAHSSALSDSRLVAMTESGWTSFQTAFIRCERIDFAAKVWDDLAKAGLKPGVTMWTGLLDTYADLRNSKQAMVTWNMMLQQGVLPDHLSYRAIISVLFDDNAASAALERFKEYQKILNTGDEGAIAVYNTVLRGLLRINRFDEAAKLMTEMKNKGPKPDLFSYNTFLGYYARQKDFKGLGDILSDMSTVNIQGDVVTFSTILSALLAVGRKDAPTTIMNLMRKQGIKPNVATYTAVIDNQMREQSQTNLEAALGLLDKMEKDDGIKPNEVTYTAILAGLYRGQWLSREQADKIRKNVVTRMRREGVTFGLPAYNILIRASLESEDESGYLDALNLIQEMTKNDVPRVGNTWFILLSGLMQRGLWDVAYGMVGTILGSGHEPNGKLKAMIQKIHRRHQIDTGRG